MREQLAGPWIFLDEKLSGLTGAANETGAGDKKIAILPFYSQLPVFSAFCTKLYTIIPNSNIDQQLANLLVSAIRGCDHGEIIL